MKRIYILIVSVLLLSMVSSHTTYAQYVTEDTQLAPTNFSYDVGQSLVYFGGGVAVFGAGVLAAQYVYDVTHPSPAEDAGTPVLPIVGYAGLVTGGILAVIGAQFWYKGAQRLGERVGLQYIGDPTGYSTRFSMSGGLAHPISMNLVRGYHFNHHLFFGVGAGLQCFNKPSMPVYLNFEYSALKRRITPYISAKLGGNFLFSDSSERDQMVVGYGGVEIGTRIRHRTKNAGHGAWSLAMFYESSEFLGGNVGVSLGYAF